MDEELAMAFSITDEGQKLEHYKHILSSFISSNDVARAKKFIDHVLSDAVPWNLSRQLLQRLAQGISTWDSSTQMDIVDYTLGQASDWKLEEAIELFNIGNEAGPVASASHSAPVENVIRWADDDTRGLNDSANNNIGLGGGGGGDDVRPPLPVVRDTLYDDATLYGASRMGYPSHEASTMIAFRNFEDEMRRPNVWETDQGATSMIENPRDNLASLYRPPFRLMFNGSFEKAKAAASAEDKWLLVNLQSTKEFSSHMLNRDTWGNETVAQSVSTSFIFWQVYDDTSEGRKVCTYYKLENIPVVLVIDPITGQKMRSWFGMVQPESLLEDLVPFMDGGPRDHHINLSHKRPRGNLSFDKKKDEVNDEDEELQKALAASLENIKDSSAVASDDKGAASDTIITEEETSSTMKPTYPSLPEEPKGDKSLLCRVGIRLPDGRRVQRNFLKTDPIQLLWSFCDSLLEGAGRKAFRLTEAIPGAKSLDYEAKLSFGESGLANSMISVAWE